jgi:hypothetical protein
MKTNPIAATSAPISKLGRNMRRGYVSAYAINIGMIPSVVGAIPLAYPAT